MILVRVARPADAAALAAVHVQCWRETYAHVLSPGFLAAQDVSQRERMWARAVERDPSRVHVAEVDGGRRAVPAWEGLVELRLVR